MTTLGDRILKLAEKVRRYRSEGVDRTLSESDTKAILVEPLLEIAGWAVRDPTQVSREDRPTRRPVDYALKIGGSPAVLVECKRLSNQLDSAGDLEQALSYASSAGVRWCVLTNGSLFRIYNSLAPEAAEKKLLEELDVARVGQTDGVPLETAARCLALLSPQSIQTRRIDEVWDERYTGIKVLEEVRELWSKRDPGLVNLVRERLKRRGHMLSRKDTSDWLGKLEVRVRIQSAVTGTPATHRPSIEDTTPGPAGPGKFSMEKATSTSEELERRLKETFARPSDLTPRLACLLEILTSEERVFSRDEVKQRFFERGIGRTRGQAGRYLSNVSQFLTNKSNPHLRQIVDFESGGHAGARKDNYRLIPQYRDLVRGVVHEWRQRNR